MAPPSKSKNSSNRSSGNGASKSTASKSTAPKDDGLNKDKDGNLIDPPVIPEFETRLLAAHNAADDELIADLTAEYNDARVKLARENADRDKRRARAARERAGVDA